MRGNRGLAEAPIRPEPLGPPLREPEPASVQQITRVHTTGYLATVDRMARGGGGNLDPDTPTSRGS